MDTLVLLMGGRNLGTIINLLRDHGKDPETAVIIVRDAGSPNMKASSSSGSSFISFPGIQSPSL